jgi:hypothetical protein
MTADRDFAIQTLPRETGMRAVLVGLGVIAPAVVGYAVDFAPASLLRGGPAMAVCLVAGVVGWRWIRAMAARAGRPIFGANARQTVGIFFAPVFVAAIAWLILVRAVPWAWTHLFGEPFRAQVMLHTEYKSGNYRKQGCRYRVRGPIIEDGSGYLCITPDQYRAHPDQDVPATLVGRRSMLGIAIERIVFTEAAP